MLYDSCPPTPASVARFDVEHQSEESISTKPEPTQIKTPVVTSKRVAKGKKLPVLR